MTSRRYRAVRDALEEADAELVRLFAGLDNLARRFVDLVGANHRSPSILRRDDLAVLRPVIFDVLTEHIDLVAGAGVVAAPDLLADAPYWLEWWWTTPAGGREALRVNLDPRAPDFFDYPKADWYAETVRSRTHRIVGPYVDYACTNAYSLTLATPVRVDARTVGVAAADVMVASLERRVVPALRGLDDVVVLANRDGRVIASNSAAWAPGLLVPANAPRESAARAHRRASPLRSWSIVDVERA